VAGNFADLDRIAVEHGFRQADGVLLDVGVSSAQIDNAERGFSFMNDGPLDMRMDQGGGMNAEDLVNEAPVEELARILREFGEEPMAGRIARRMAAERKHSRISSTRQLAMIIEEAVPRRGRKIHPATRTFQALRIAVNDELGNLEKGLSAGLNILANGGRFAVITFHSLEDRIVKRTFAKHAGRWESLAAGGQRFIVEKPVVSLVTRKPLIPSDAEMSANSRARSSKLRVVEKIE
jgi:16S rRNA (cytosine1402-N4)-methyltransferase